MITVKCRSKKTLVIVTVTTSIKAEKKNVNAVVDDLLVTQVFRAPILRVKTGAQGDQLEPVIRRLPDTLDVQLVRIIRT